jgi:hypothetical protein
LRSVVSSLGATRRALKLKQKAQEPTAGKRACDCEEPLMNSPVPPQLPCVLSLSRPRSLSPASPCLRIPCPRLHILAANPTLRLPCASTPCHPAPARIFVSACEPVRLRRRTEVAVSPGRLSASEVAGLRAGGCGRWSRACVCVRIYVVRCGFFHYLCHR